MNAVKIKPIETTYKGYRFRSRLEARWAVFFDALGIKYEYEPEGFQLSDGTLYLPDFWLPESKTFFEVKGVMGSDDAHKIEQLMRDSHHPVVIGYSDFQFEAADNVGPGSYSQETKTGSYFVKCRQCGAYHFIGEAGAWDCTGCGYYDGDNTSEWLLRGDGKEALSWDDHSEVIEAIEKARGARFEHGEKPQI